VMRSTTQTLTCAGTRILQRRTWPPEILADAVGLGVLIASLWLTARWFAAAPWVIALRDV
jgi:hypothetical protein